MCRDLPGNESVSGYYEDIYITKRMRGTKVDNLLYETDYGKYYIGKCEELIEKLDLEGKCNC